MGEYFSAWQVQGRVLGIGGSQFYQASLAKSEYHPAHSTPINGTGTHTARLRAGIQRAVRKIFGAVELAGFSHQIRLGMAGAVPFGHDCVFGF